MSMTMSPNEPLVVYGTTASYYTGKLEAYLRAKGIPYRLEPFSESNMRRAAGYTGVVQVPQVECPDGSWLLDTTLIIEHFEHQHPEPRVTPRAPAVAFVSQLIEDYADEWLWRPAMHYRWSFPETARLMSAWLAEHLADRPAPQWLKRRYWRRRQFRTFVRGDGVTEDTRDAVEGFYLETLATLESVFARRPYVLGGMINGKTEHDLVESADGKSLVDQQLMAISAQLVAAQSGLTEKKAAYDRVAALSKTGNGADVTPVVNSKMIGDLRMQEAEVVRQEADLATRYGPNHPKMVSIRNEKRNLAAKISGEVTGIAGSMQSELEVARAHVGSIEASDGRTPSPSAGSMLNAACASNTSFGHF